VTRLNDEHRSSRIGGGTGRFHARERTARHHDIHIVGQRHLFGGLDNPFRARAHLKCEHGEDGQESDFQLTDI